MVAFLYPALFFLGGLAGSLVALFYAYLKKKQLHQTRLSIDTLLRKAQEDVERERKAAQLELKNDLYKKRSDFELEMKREKIELQRLQNKCQKKEDMLDHRETLLDDLRKELQQKERDLARKLDVVGSQEEKIKRLYDELVLKLEKLSGIKQDEAKRILFESLTKEVKLANQKWIAKVEEESRELAKQKSVDILCSAMQRYLPEQVTLHSSSVIHLPNEEMKGRIIGKEGRNIKALEMATGMEFVIGDTPEIITISGFNPIRREIAKRSLTKLIQDGRINPTRIEETVLKCEEEIEHLIVEIGQQTVLEFGFRGVHQEIVRLLGKLHFRTSYTQNQLVHCKEVAYFARMIAAELGLDPEIAARGGLLHDIGKAVSAEVDGPHAIIGGDLAKEYGEDPIVVNAIASHHEEVPPISIYGFIVHLADAISASRPGARKETLSTYIKRLEQLEEIASCFEGVKKAYALQAGREIRVIVDEDRMDDEKSHLMAHDLAKRIEEEMAFPGEIKVNVIREKRFIQTAR
ncbi:ribonuclease Y [Candidatus Dependentiae bacterium]|nr:ribonuclease Y [Candidatus Dependentiae bacterium]